MMLCVFFLADMHVLLKTGIGIIAYAALALAFRAIDPEMVKELLHRKQAFTAATER